MWGPILIQKAGWRCAPPPPFFHPFTPASKLAPFGMKKGRSAFGEPAFWIRRGEWTRTTGLYVQNVAR